MQPCGLCPAQSFPVTSAPLSLGRESGSAERGLGAPLCWGLGLQLCFPGGVQGLGRGRGGRPPSSLQGRLHVGIPSSDGLGPVHSQGWGPRGEGAQR